MQREVFQSILNQLGELRREVQNNDSIDENLASRLQQISEDLTRLAEANIAEPQTTAVGLSEEPDSEPESPNLGDRLVELTEEFEASHPRLTELIGQIAAALSRIGI